MQINKLKKITLSCLLVLTNLSPITVSASVSEEYENSDEEQTPAEEVLSEENIEETDETGEEVSSPETEEADQSVTETSTEEKTDYIDESDDLSEESAEDDNSDLYAAFSNGRIIVITDNEDVVANENIIGNINNTYLIQYYSAEDAYNACHYCIENSITAMPDTVYGDAESYQFFNAFSVIEGIEEPAETEEQARNVYLIGESEYSVSENYEYINLYDGIEDDAEEDTLSGYLLDDDDFTITSLHTSEQDTFSVSAVLAAIAYINDNANDGDVVYFTQDYATFPDDELAGSKLKDIINELSETKTVIFHSEEAIEERDWLDSGIIITDAENGGEGIDFFIEPGNELNLVFWIARNNAEYLLNNYKGQVITDFTKQSETLYSSNLSTEFKASKRTLFSLLRGSVTDVTDFEAEFVSGGTLQEYDGNEAYYWTATRSDAGHEYVFRIKFSTSGVDTIEPGTFVIRIPRSIIKDRYGNYADNISVAVPSKEEADAEVAEKGAATNDYAYTIDTDTNEIVIYNYNEVSAARDGYIEVSYSTSKKTYYYVDMARSDPFQAVLTINDTTNTTDELYVGLNTTAEIKSIAKKYPEQYKAWNTKWGSEPADADDYWYLEWELQTGVMDHVTQQYKLQYLDTILSATGWKTVDGVETEYSIDLTGNVDVVGFIKQNTSQYVSATNEYDLLTSGIFYDKVITRHKKSTFTSYDRFEIINKITANLYPLDEVDDMTTATATQRFAYQMPTFTKPIGTYTSWKRADGAFRTYSTEWDKSQSVIYSNTGVNLEYLGMIAGEYSRYDIGDLEDDNSKVGGFDYATWVAGYPFTATLDDDSDWEDTDKYWTHDVTFTLQDDTLYLYEDGGTVSTRQLTADDYQFDSISFNVKGYAGVFSEEEQKFIRSYLYWDSTKDILHIYAKFSDGEYVEVATKNLGTNAINYDSTYVTSMGTRKISFVDGCTGYKLVVTNPYYFTEIDAVPNVSLKGSTYVKSIVSAYESIALDNETHSYVTRVNSEDETETIYDYYDRDTDFARKAVKDSVITKEVVSSQNNTKDKNYSITWKVYLSEGYTTADNQRYAINQISGVYYDLLPESAAVDESSVQVQTNSGYIDSSSIETKLLPNYKGSGRTLLIVYVNESFDWAALTFNTIHGWDEITDYGVTVYNPIAFETGNNEIAEGYSDDGGNLPEDYNGVNYRLLMADLDSETDGSKFVYAEEEYDIVAITSATTGLTKRVKSITDTDYSDEAETTANGYYSYRFRFQTSTNTSAKNMILYDSLENYGVNGMIGEDKVTHEPDWKGTLESVDLYQLKQMGIDPVVYLSDISYLDLRESAGNTDISDTTKWQEYSAFIQNHDNGLADAKAIAIDARKDTDGEDFILEPAQSISITLNMKAPESVTVTESRIPETFNDVFMGNTVIDEYGNENDFYFRHDFTTTIFKILVDFKISKLSSQTEEGIKGIKFRVEGTSEYGNEFDLISSSDKNGVISFSELEPGNYTFYEYEAGSEWIEDHTLHTLVVGEDGSITVDGDTSVDYASTSYTIHNTPRVHANIEFFKIAETQEDTDLEDTEILASSSYSGTVIPNAVFELSGTSGYGEEIVKYATSDVTGKVTFKDISLGRYELKEITPNGDFIVNETIWTVIVDDTGAATIYEPTDSSKQDRLYQLTRSGKDTYILNEPRYWNFNLIKVDGENNEIYLEGAKFRFYGTSDLGTAYDITLDSTATDSKGQGYLSFENIEKGTYLLEETQVPTNIDEQGKADAGGTRNYLADGITRVVEVGYNGVVSVSNTKKNDDDDLVIENDRALSGEIIIYKYWEDDGNDDSRPYPEIHLAYTDKYARKKVTATVYIKDNDLSYSTDDSFMPDSITVNIGTSDGTVVATTQISKSNRYTDSSGYIYWQKDVSVPKQDDLYAWIEDGSSYASDNPTTNKATVSDGDIGSTTLSVHSSNAYILTTGENFNVKLKTLAGSSSPATTTENSSIKSFKRSETAPNASIDAGSTGDISKYQDGKIVAWFDSSDGTVYWYSDAETVLLNSDCANMFECMTGIDTIDFTDLSSDILRNVRAMFSTCNALTTVNADLLDISNCTSLAYTFYRCNALTTVPVSNWDTSNITDMSHLFDMYTASSALTSLDLTKWNTSKVTDMNSMFNFCVNLPSLDVSSFDTSNVTLMNWMFKDLRKITSIAGLENFNTSKVTTMEEMFYCDSIIPSLDLSSFDTSNVTDMAHMFRNSYALAQITGIENFNTSKVEAFQYMFSYISVPSLDLSGWDTSSATSMESMFYGCGSTTSIKVSNFKNTASIKNMFYGCTSLTDLDVSNFDTSKVTDMSYTFYKCQSLQELDISSFTDTALTSSSDVAAMFSECSNLTTIYASMDFDLSFATTATVFSNTPKIIGGQGTEYRNNYAYYGRIDNAQYSPGYFTLASKYIVPYTVVYNSNDENAAGTMENQSFTAGERKRLSENQFSVTGKVFIGWNTKADGTGTTYVPDQYVCYLSTTENDIVTLYAQWSDATETTLEAGNQFYNDIRNKLIDTSSLNSVNQITAMSRSQTLPTDVIVYDISDAKDASVLFWYAGNGELKWYSPISTVVLNADMSYMFAEFGITDVANLNLNEFDTSVKYTTVSGLFSRCSSLQTADITSLDISEAFSASSMFFSCSNLTTVRMGALTTAMKYPSDMFSNCSILSAIYVTQDWDITGASYTSDMFKNCISLVGGSGTVYNSTYTDGTYAHVDGGTTNPGYLTLIQ